MDKTTVRTKIKHFVDENFIKGRNAISYADNDSFLENEIIDSTGVLELVLYLEETFDIKVEDDEITPENLDSIDNLISYIAKKKI